MQEIQHPRSPGFQYKRSAKRRVNAVVQGLLICILWLKVSICQGDQDRLWLDTTINGKPAKLIFDTGASHPMLWRNAAQGLGLRFTEPPDKSTVEPGEFPMGVTELCNLSLEGIPIRTRFGVIDIPDFLNMDCDGVIGWGQLKRNIFQIDAEPTKVTLLHRVPEEAAEWIQFAIATNSDALTLEIRRDDTGNGTVTLDVDTGSPHGVSLPPERWSAWKKEHTNQPWTMKAFYMPADGVVAMEETWAEEISFGPLVLYKVPIMESTPSETLLGGEGYIGTLGLYALKRLEVIIDGRNGVAYMRPREAGAAPYTHNRLGAVFVPIHAESEELIARVADGSPAQEAGVQTGDVLLEVDGIEVTNWPTEVAGYNEAKKRFLMPAGTKIHLSLKRNGKVFETTATLRQILPPDSEEE